MKDDQPELHPRCKLEEEVEEVSSQDPGWELSSDWTASPVSGAQSERAITACSYYTEQDWVFDYR